MRDLDELSLALEYCAQHLVDTANKLRRFAPDGSWHYKTLEFGAKFLREYDAIEERLAEREAEIERLNKECISRFLHEARVKELEKDLARERDICGVLRAALKCNETFHRLGGIDDCEPCKALAQEQQMRK